MTGKEKCRLLKAIRREIAEHNGIVYLSSECTFDGDCKGTCPKCDSEIRYLDNEINRMISEGKTVHIADISLPTYLEKLNTDTHDDGTDTNGETFPQQSPFEGGLLNTPEMGAVPIKIEPQTIDDIDLSVASRIYLKKVGIMTPQDLTSKTVADMKQIDGIENKMIEEIERKLSQHDMHLKARRIDGPLIRAIITGFAIGDAMGVPVEFSAREGLQQLPVTGFRGYGTHHVPAGTWSDDTSMTLATLDSLLDCVDEQDIMEKFCLWKEHAAYTATDEVFDMGISTNNALKRFRAGVPAQDCGGAEENDNGNGSLMRIIPVVLFCHIRQSNSYNIKQTIEQVHRISALTHAHPRSKMACGIYAFILMRLLDVPVLCSVEIGLKDAFFFYSADPEFAGEMSVFRRLFDDNFRNLPENEISSSGYVVSTLEAAVWCLLNTDSYRACILKAVNLGRDTDTVAAIAGGLAGCLYGPEGIPQEWLKDLRKITLINCLCDQFMGIESKQP